MQRAEPIAHSFFSKLLLSSTFPVNTVTELRASLKCALQQKRRAETARANLPLLIAIGVIN